MSDLNHYTPTVESAVGTGSPLRAAAPMGCAEPPSAQDFVRQVAALKLWGEPDIDNDGEPFEPIDGLEDSHQCLMDLIEQARILVQGMASEERANQRLHGGSATSENGQRPCRPFCGFADETGSYGSVS